MQNMSNNWDIASKAIGLSLQKKSPRYAEYISNINYDPRNLYRAIGDEGLEEALKSRILGPGSKFAAKPNAEVFYSLGKAEQEYVTGNRSAIVEAKPNSKLIHGPSTNSKLPNHYYYTNNTTGNLNLNDRLRLWATDGPGTPHRVVYDNYSAPKYYGRKMINTTKAITPLGLFLEALIHSPEAGTGSDIIGSRGNR